MVERERKGWERRRREMVKGREIWEQDQREVV